MTPLADTLDELAVRVEEAQGADRQIDEAIRLLLEHGISVALDLAGGYVPPSTPAVTASLDAAMQLVPEGCEWRVSWGELPDRSWAGIAGVQGLNTASATPALALTAASLRARASLLRKGGV